VLRTVKEKKNILHKINRWKTKLIGHIRRRKCLLRLVIEGKIEGKGRGGIRGKHLLGDFRKREDIGS
jgi:hypothetical protein